jgi:hypothetical protein
MNWNETQVITDREMLNLAFDYLKLELNLDKWLEKYPENFI